MSPMMMPAPPMTSTMPGALVLPAVPLMRSSRRARSAFPLVTALRAEGPLVTALRADGPMLMPTHPIHNAMRRGLLTISNDREELVKLRVGGEVRLMRVRIGFQPREGKKEAPRDANLLKTHLDLVEQARRQPMGFRYDLPEALNRMGYKRGASGSFHPDTLKALTDRLAHLSDMHVSTEEQDTPYWRFIVDPLHQAPRTIEGPGAADALRNAPNLLVVPGEWWNEIELARYNAPLARKLVNLPMDGNGNEVNRLALLLAAELAVWLRAERRKGASKIARPIGTLLEKAMAADKLELLADAAKRLNTPKRLRSYLAGEGFADEGALALLRDLAGLDVDVKDEAAFWAAGRGWVERFWNAKLAIGLPEEDRPLATWPAVAGELAIAHRRV